MDIKRYTITNSMIPMTLTNPVPNTEESPFSLHQTAPSRVSSDEELIGTNEMLSVDFKNMSRKELFEWVNQQIKDNELTLDETDGFLAMTICFPAYLPLNQAIELENSNKLDFIELAKHGLQWANEMNHYVMAEQLKTSINLMNKFQKSST